MIRSKLAWPRLQYWFLTLFCTAALYAQADVQSLLPVTLDGTWVAETCRRGMDSAEGTFALDINTRRRISGWFTNSVTEQVLPVRGQITRRGQLTAHVQAKLTLRGVVSGTTNAAVQGLILRQCIGTFESYLPTNDCILPTNCCVVPTNCCVIPTNPPPLFPDTNLAAYVSEILGKPIEQIRPADLVALDRVDLFFSSVRDLTGLQYATNLSLAVLQYTMITNYSALYQLPALRELYLSHITNGTFLSNFTRLERLGLQYSDLGDAATLLPLTNLYELDFFQTHVTNVSALANLPWLFYFSHESETIADAIPYGDLKQLRSLNLDGPFSDLTSFSTLTNLQGLDLGSRPRTNFAAGLSSLVNLYWLSMPNTDMPDLNWLNAPGVGSLYLPDNLITDLSPLAGLQSLYSISLSGNPLTNLVPLTQVPNLASLSISRLGLKDISFAAGLQKLSWLSAEENLIEDISSLKNCPLLHGIYLNQNRITDLSPLAACTNLSSATFNDNEIHTLPSLSNLSRLSWLELAQNAISDLSPLTNITALAELRLDGNLITNIDALASLPRLTSISLRTNAITDITALASLPQLTRIDLEQNGITNVSPLLNLTNLYYVSLYQNPLDLSAGSTASNVLHTLRSRGVYVLPWQW
jgi:internalin A